MHSLVYEHLPVLMYWTYLTNIRVRISKTEQQMWQNMDNVRFEQTAKHLAKHFKRQQGPFFASKWKINTITTNSKNQITI